MISFCLLLLLHGRILLLYTVIDGKRDERETLYHGGSKNCGSTKANQNTLPECQAAKMKGNTPGNAIHFCSYPLRVLVSM